jgi:hypothetical protein
MGSPKGDETFNLDLHSYGHKKTPAKYYALRGFFCCFREVWLAPRQTQLLHMGCKSLFPAIHGYRNQLRR